MRYPTRLSLRTLILIGVAALLFGCTWAAKPSEVTVYPKETPFVCPAPDKGLVYFYRPKISEYRGVDYFVYNGFEKIGALRAGSYFHYYAEPGTQVFWAKANSIQQVAFSVEPGKTYFVRSDLKADELWMPGRPYFTTVSKNVGESELMTLPYIHLN